MAIRNVFGSQSIRQKLLLGTLFLAIIPVAVTSVIVGHESLVSGRTALESQARETLIAQRASKAAQITDYFDSLSNQVQVLAASPDVVTAMRELPAAYDNSVLNIADLSAERVRLAKYYTGDFIGEYQKRNTGRNVDMSSTVANLPDLAMNLQYQYIAANPHPLGAKNALDRANDGSRYSELHGQIHPYLRTALKQFGLYDIFLVEPRNGTVVYTVFKELDFATSLVNGPYSKTKLGDAFRQAWALDRPGMVALSEFGEYLPSYNDQAAFLGTPVFDGGRKIGVLLVQVPIDKINSVMTHEGKWKERGLGDTGETYLVSAADGTPRSIARGAVEDLNAYSKSVLAAGFAQGLANAVQAKGTSIGLVPIKTQATTDTFEKGTAGFGVYPNYAKQSVLGAYAPLNVLGLKWAIVAEIQSAEAFKPVIAVREKVVVWSTGIAVALLGLGLLIAFSLLRSVTRPITKLQDTVTRISEGDFAARSDLGGDDEFGQLSRAFDHLLDDRVARLAEAERENEDLNNSVVQLLQAVAQLSNKDLTAKAPVTANVIGTVSDSINLLAHETGRVLSEVTSIAAQVKLSTERVKRQAESVNATAAAERSDVERASENLANANKVMTQVAELAAASNRAAEQATSSTVTALGSVNETVRGMEGIRESIAEAEKRIKRLGERSQEITGIVNLINTIAERTHVLALNASMQAAAAGDAGRGFAVVAEEVQRLAESSRQATQQIAQLVNNIQIETSDTINTVNKTISQVVSGSELAAKSGAQMRETQQSTASLVELVKRITSSAQVQMKITTELRNRVHQIGASTEKTAAEILLQSEATSDLSKSADRLVESVRVFKLPTTSRAA
ncbi:MAG TPA: HAMP domain-containing methyl-accepting chemotaxis protein [Steroidobacteraceae bacterium]|nr:HAMP domain-containing methyl-accepting chemotaxis protein [Steroidobacteraceae bacterium]